MNPNLKTKYMGIELRNPIIIGASNLSANIDNLKRLEESGAAAIVYKSLFEEQIQLESIKLQEELEAYNDRHAEMIRLFPEIIHAGPDEYLYHLKEARKALHIPLFASLNGMYLQTWIEYAQLIQETGVDGIELNFYQVPDSFETKGDSIIEKQIKIIVALKTKLKIPISVKLDPFYTNPLNVISRMNAAGVKGFVLFNRLFEPDINVEKEEHIAPLHLSNEGDYRMSLRYAGILYNNINADICTNTGIYKSEDVVKMILSGADCVQVVSAVYKHKNNVISTLLSGLESWMKSKGYKTIDEFRGKLSKVSVKDPYIYKRAQYIDMIMNGSEEIIRKYPMR